MGTNPLSLKTAPLSAVARPNTPKKKHRSGIGGYSAEVPDLEIIEEGLIAVAQSCADALAKSLLHYQGEPPWKIGAMPACEAQADALEAQARSLLTNSQLSMRDIDWVASELKSICDLRTVARCAVQVTQLCWLFREDGTSAKAIEWISRVGNASSAVTSSVANALTEGDRNQLRHAALLYRNVDTLRFDAEQFVRSDIAISTFSPAVHRMVRAGVLFMAIAGESSARVAARSIG